MFRLPARCAGGARNLGPDQLLLRVTTLLYGVFCDGPDAAAETQVFRRRFGGRPEPIAFDLALVNGFDLGPGGRPFASGYFSETRARLSGLTVRVGDTLYSDPEISPAIEQVRLDRDRIWVSRCHRVELVTQGCTIERAVGARAVTP